MIKRLDAISRSLVRIARRFDRNAGLIIVVFVVLLIMFHEASVHIEFSHGFLYFVAVLSGNWSSDFAVKITPFWFSIGCLFAVLLNGLTIGGVIAVFLKLTLHHEFFMNIQNAITLQEATLKDEVLNIFNDEQLAILRPQIEEAFRKGHDVWEKKVVPDILGERAANSFFKRILQSLDND